MSRIVLDPVQQPRPRQTMALSVDGGKHRVTRFSVATVQTYYEIGELTHRIGLASCSVGRG